MKSNPLFLALGLLSILIFSCKKESDNQPKGALQYGAFIVNEGLFNGGTGTISYYSFDTRTVAQNLFEKVNAYPLGNVVQSMALFGSRAYIVVNNAGKMVVVDDSTFGVKGVVSNLEFPAAFIGISTTKGYVSQWNGKVAVVDLNTFHVGKQIPVGGGPEGMLQSAGKVFVANLGGFSVDSTLSVIDTLSDAVVKTIAVGAAPESMVLDAQGNIWVACKGRGFTGYPQAGDTPGSLIHINASTLEVDYVYPFVSTGSHPVHLTVDTQSGNLFFLMDNAIYKTNAQIPLNAPAKVSNRSFYSLAFSQHDRCLYACDPTDYVSNGYVYRINSSTGGILDSIPAGIIPRQVVFTE